MCLSVLWMATYLLYGVPNLEMPGFSFSRFCWLSSILLHQTAETRYATLSLGSLSIVKRHLEDCEPSVSVLQLSEEWQNVIYSRASASKIIRRQRCIHLFAGRSDTTGFRTFLSNFPVAREHGPGTRQTRPRECGHVYYRRREEQSGLVWQSKQPQDRSEWARASHSPTLGRFCRPSELVLAQETQRFACARCRMPTY